MKWISTEFGTKDRLFLDELKKHLDSIKDADMVRLELNGDLPLECKEELDNLLEFQTTVYKDFRVVDNLNITIPPMLEKSTDFGDPALEQTEINLKQLLSNETDPEKKIIIIEALVRLQRLGKGAKA